MTLAMTSPIVPLVVVPNVDRCDECGVDLTGRHKAVCRGCGAALCCDCDTLLAWDLREDPAGPTLCGWCYLGHLDAVRAALLAQLLEERERPVPDRRPAELRRALRLVKGACDGSDR